jgi:hypothetical protein
LIRYRQGKGNVVADALSRKDKPTGQKAEQVMLSREVLEYGVHPDDQEEDQPRFPTTVAPVSTPISVDISPIVDRVLQMNRTNE